MSWLPPTRRRAVRDIQAGITLVPKLQLGNQNDEALASRDWKLELPVPNSQAGVWGRAVKWEASNFIPIHFSCFSCFSWTLIVRNISYFSVTNTFSILPSNANGRRSKKSRETGYPRSVPTSNDSLAVKAAGTVRFTFVRASSWPSTVSTTSAGAPGLAIVVSTSIRCLPAAKSALGTGDCAFDDHHVVLVDQVTLVHIQREAAGSAALGHRGSLRRYRRARHRWSRGCSRDPGPAR